MRQRHNTALLCMLYEYFVSEVSGQDKDRDKERVENGECRTGVFYLAPWLNQGNPEISTVFCFCKDI